MKQCEWCGKNPAYKYHGTINVCPTCRSRLDKFGRLEKNRYINKGEYYEVITTNKDNTKITGSLLIDKEDYDRCKYYSWYIRNDGYGIALINNKKVLMSKFILNKNNNAGIIDHINRKRNDNRKNNLRLCSTIENSRNHSLSKKNTSGYTGVTWDKDNKKWVAQITVNGKNIKLGRYKNIHEALISRLQAEIKYFNQFSSQKELINELPYAKELIMFE